MYELKVYLRKDVNPHEFASDIGTKKYEMDDDGALFMPMKCLGDIIDRNTTGEVISFLTAQRDKPLLLKL
jgi:hypothetical protein